jgi:hypothetical protein
VLTFHSVVRVYPSENHPNIGTQFGIVGGIATKMVVVFTDAAI